MSLPEGIRLRHGRGCPIDPCDCSPAYQAVVRARDGRKLRRSFRKLSDAVAWRDEARIGVRQRTVITPTSLTFREYAERWLEGARAGINLTRDLSAYKPSTVRSYAKHIKRVYPALGRMRLSDIELQDLQDAANQLTASGLKRLERQEHVRPGAQDLRASGQGAADRGQPHGRDGAEGPGRPA